MATECQMSDDLSELGREEGGVQLSSASSISNEMLSDHMVGLSETEDSSSCLEPSSSETESSCFVQATNSQSAVVNPSFPHRLGIVWQKGQRLEAQDFQMNWYSSKIVEIEEEKKVVLIHFEGWNQRYDEWISMDSERLRQLTRHSDRKGKGRLGRTVYKAGDQVLAKWTDCKMYLAKVAEVLPDGSYMVLFYDGFKKNVQPINLKPAPVEQKLKKFKIRPPVLSPHDLQKIKSKPVDFKGGSISPNDTCAVNEKVERLVHKSSGSAAAARRGRLIISGSLFSKKDRMVPSAVCDTDQEKKKFVQAASKASATITSALMASEEKVGVETPEQAVAENKTAEPQLDAAPAEASPASAETAAEALATAASEPAATTTAAAVTTTAATTPPATTAEAPTADAQLQHAAAETQMVMDGPVDNQEAAPAISDTAGSLIQASEAGSQTNLHVALVAKKSKKRPRSGSFPSEKRRRSKAAKVPKPLGMVKKARSADTKPLESPVVSALPVLLPPLPVMPPKAFRVEEDHNPWKCQECGKGFRKQQLLLDHLKHYHTADHHLTTPVTGRKRRKTLSTCSAESDKSVSSKSNSAKRRRHISDISVGSPDIVMKMSFEEESPSSLSVGTEPAEAPSLPEVDEEAMDEVVNCVCGLSEETGTMIQCDCCLCWQHTSCVGLTDADLASDDVLSTYYCSVCRKPAGVRDSGRYLYDMDWFRRGRLPALGFVGSQANEEREKEMLQTHEMAAELISLQRVMHGLREEIALTGEKDHPELRLWMPRSAIQTCTVAVSTADGPEAPVSPRQGSVPAGADDAVPKPNGPQPVADPNSSAVQDSQAATSGPAIDIAAAKVGSQPASHRSDGAVDSSPMLALASDVDGMSKDSCGDSSNIKDVAGGVATGGLSPPRVVGEASSRSESDSGELKTGRDSVRDAGQVGSENTNLLDFLEKAEGDQDAVSAVRVDPFSDCKLSVLNYVRSVQEELARQLDSIELQIAAAEHEEFGADSGYSFSSVSNLKVSLQRLARDLHKVKLIASYR